MDDEFTLDQWVRWKAQLRFDRSSGPGGQNVNKVNSKVTLVLALDDWPFGQEEVLRERLGGRINTENELVVQCDETRSQLKNRELVVVRAISMLQSALAKRKKRRPTRPSRAAKERRLDEKRRRSALKRDRNWRE
jgi:ribosome-associated protein